MSQNFKLKFDELREGKPTEKGDAVENTYETFDTPGHVRNLCFVWPDGRKKFLNYAYLVSGEYSPNDGSITLIFTTDTVVIKGSGLDGIFEALVNHLPMRICCKENRFIEVAINESFSILEIKILKN